MYYLIVINIFVYKNIFRYFKIWIVTKIVHKTPSLSFLCYLRDTTLRNKIDFVFFYSYAHSSLNYSSRERPCNI